MFQTQINEALQLHGERIVFFLFFLTPPFDAAVREKAPAFVSRHSRHIILRGV